jgi:hypothetical protein
MLPTGTALRQCQRVLERSQNTTSAVADIETVYM